MDVIKELQRRTGIKYSDEQLAILQEKGGIAIRACAGSAKTTVLTHLLAKRLLNNEIDGSKVLCTTFSVAGAKEIENRLNLLLDKMNYQGKRIKVKTLHAVYLELLRVAGVTLDVCTSRLPYLKKALAEKKIFLNTEDSNLELNDLDNVISYSINNMISNDLHLATSSVFIQATEPLNIKLETFIEIKKRVAELKKADRVMDYDDMQLYAYILLVNRNDMNCLNHIRKNYEYLYLDEFQDISKIQFQILRKMVQDPQKLMVVGDDDQCIYEWRGAAPEILNNITAYYPIKQMHLSTNYRCGSVIVENARRGIECATSRVLKEIKAFREGGEVIDVPIRFDLIDNYSDYDEVELSFYNNSMKIADLVEKEIKENKTDSKDIAILIRDNNHADILIQELFRRGIHTTNKRKLGLKSSFLMQDYVKIMQLAYDSKRIDNLNKIVYKLAPGISYAIENLLFQIMNTLSCSLEEAIYHLLSVVSSFYSPLQDEYQTLSTSLRKQIATNGRKISFIGINNLKSLYHLLAKRENSRDLAFMLIGKLTDSVLSKTKSIKTKIYTCSVREFVSGILMEKSLYETISFFEMLNAYANSADVIGVPCVDVRTMHSAKGLEFKVVILGFNDIWHFPNSNILSRMREVCKPDEVQSYIEGERRLFYVACTRAVERLYLVRPNNSANVSQFRLEQMCSGNNTSQDGKDVSNIQILDTL